MHLRLGPHALLAACVMAAAACTNATSPSARLTITMPPDFSATVSKAEFEGGNGPAGPYEQYDIWVVIPPATTANAGVVLGKSVPVFVMRGGGIAAADAGQIRVGDQIQVWRDPIRVGYGAVQAPPNAPVYTGTQVVIVR